MRLAKGIFDAACNWELPGTVPPGTSGLTVMLLAFGQAKSGTLLATNPATLTIQ